MNCSKLFLVSSLLVLPSLSQAQLGTIVITGTKTEVAVSKSAVPVEIITSDEIRNSVATDVADILEMHGGLEIARNGDFGKVTSLFIRGTNSNHAVILIDGVKINPGTLGLAALQNISPDIIERIEIVKGPRSSLYGSEAIGGVVNIITRKKLKTTSGLISIGVGEEGTKKTTLSGSYEANRVSTGITFSQFDTDGIPAQENSREDHGFDNGSLNAFVEYRLNRSDLRLNHWEAKGNVEYYSFGDLAQDFENSSTALVWEFAATSWLSTNLRGSSISDKITQNQPALPAVQDYADTQRNEIEFRMDISIDDSHLLSAGLLSSDEEVDALSFGSSIVESNEVDAIYLQFQADSAQHIYAVAVRNTDNGKFGQHSTWNIDYQYPISSQSRIYSGIGTAFRAPNSSERFVGWGGDPDLKPETSRNLELGWQFSSGTIEHLGINLFKTSIEDMIGYDSSFQAANINEVEITGIEFDYRGISARWHYGVNMLIQDPKDKSDDSTLLKRAKKRTNIDLSKHAGVWTAGVNLAIVGERKGVGSVTLASYELLNTFARYRLTQSSNISAKIENLLDEDYETSASFNTKGRSAYFEYTYTFGE